MNFLVTDSFTFYTESNQKIGSSTILFYVENNQKRHKLCIGKDYIFTKDGINNEERVNVQGRISLIPCDDLRQKQIDNKLSEKSIGRVSFLKENADEFYLYHEPNTIWFDVYINSRLFNEIKDNLRFKNKSINIWLDIGGLVWGWEPDNSHQIWGFLPSQDVEIPDSRGLVNLDIFDFQIRFNHL